MMRGMTMNDINSHISERMRKRLNCVRYYILEIFTPVYTEHNQINTMSNYNKIICKETLKNLLVS